MQAVGACENVNDWNTLFGDVDEFGNKELSEEMLSLYNNLRIAKSIAEQEKEKR